MDPLVDTCTSLSVLMIIIILIGLVLCLQIMALSEHLNGKDK